MKVTAFIASARKVCDVSQLCGEILRGAAQRGFDTEVVNLSEANIKSCIGCFSCTKTHKCALNDDFQTLFEKETQSEVIVYGTPIYSHSVSNVLKKFIESHAHAIIPFVKDPSGLGYFGRVATAMDYMKGFKTKVFQDAYRLGANL